MPRPSRIEPLPPLPGLPAALHRLAEIYLTRATSADELLLLADACDELFRSTPGMVFTSLLALADDLRRRAPRYA